MAPSNEPVQPPTEMRDLEKANHDVLPGTDIPKAAIESGHILPEDIIKHSHDADVALKAFASYGGEVIHIDEATNKRLLRKIDWNLMPVA
jgi:ACS family allantoate permease-like MFS transporter